MCRGEKGFENVPGTEQEIPCELLLIAAGMRNGSAKDVFGKAVKICTECVGLG